MVEERKEPKLRFPGFTDPWEQRKVGDVSKRVIVGLATSVTPYYREEGIPILRNLNIKENYLDDTDILFLEKSYAESQVSKQIHTGDVLTVHTGYIGTSCVVPEKYDNCLTFTTLITTTDDAILRGEFLAQYLNSEIGMSAVQAVTTQGGRQNLNTNDFVKVEIRYPSLAEQDGICKILRNIDNLITLHQRKRDQVKTLKKAMLQKMLPKEGESIPEIRFPGFTDPWERRKLGDIADVTKLAGFEFTEHVVYSDVGSIIALRGLNIKNGQLILDDVKYIDRSNFSKLNRSKLYIDDIMFTYVGTVGEVAIIKENDRFYLAPNVSRIRVQSDDSPKFISHYMRTDSFYKRIIYPLIATSSQPALSMENIRKFEVCLPIKREEQDRLSEYFDSLYNLISLHQRKCDELKELKKGLLQQMFI